MTAEGLAGDENLRGFVQEKLSAHNTNYPGMSTRIARVAFLIEPPSMDGQEISDKGTVNQSIALRRRASDVERLYAKELDGTTIILD